MLNTAKTSTLREWTESVKPLFMWAGGKTKLLKHYQPVFDTLGLSGIDTPGLSAPRFDQYVEPFFGGGAVFCHLSSYFSLHFSLHFDSKNSLILNDSNKEIMGVYRAIRDDPDSFLRHVDSELDRFFRFTDKDSRKSYYYALRESYWSNPNPSTIFVLMRLGFNGLWKTCAKSNGLYGTPAGLLNHTSRDQVYTRSNVMEWHSALQGATLLSGDYGNSFPVGQHGGPTGSINSIDLDKTLVYMDPPYRGSSITYGNGFNDENQAEAVEWAKSLASRGATVLFANRCVERDSFFENLLEGSSFHYFDVKYTAGRRKKTSDGFEAKKAKEFLAIVSPD